MKDLSKRAREILDKIEYATIATVDIDSNPWNAPVFMAYDEDYNFYWGTHKDSQKARNIRANNQAFMVIYDSTAPAGTGEGVYIRAEVEELSDKEEIERAITYLTNRHEDYRSFADGKVIRLYKAVVKQAWINDGYRENGRYIDIRKEVTLRETE